MDELEARMLKVFQKVFEDESLVVSGETTAGDVPGWDSLRHMDLIYHTEKEFGLKFKFRDLRRLRNVGDLLAIVRDRATK